MLSDLFEGTGQPVASEPSGVRLRPGTAPGAVTDGRGNVDVIAVDAGGGLVHRRFLGELSASAYTRIGREPVFVGTPLVLRGTDGRVHVLCRDVAGWIRHAAQTRHAATTWSAWSTLHHTGPVMSDPCGVVGRDGRIDVYTIDATGVVLHAHLPRVSDRWPAWAPAGAPALRGNLSVAAVTDTVHLVGAAPDGTLRHRAATASRMAGPIGTPVPWTTLPGHVTGAPLVVAGPAPADIWVAARGDDGRPRCAWSAPGGRWSAFHRYDGAGVIPASARFAGVRGRDTCALFVRNSHGELLRLSLTGGGQRAWRAVGTSITSDVAAVPATCGRIQLFAIGQAGTLVRITLPGRP